MPVVQITLLHGRTADQKRKIAKRITDALVEEAGARREAIIVAFNEVSKESYARVACSWRTKGNNSGAFGEGGRMQKEEPNPRAERWEMVLPLPGIAASFRSGYGVTS